MQEITKSKTILKGFIKSFATQVKKKTNNLLTMIDTHSYMYHCNQTIWGPSGLPPLRPGFDPRDGLKWESW